MKNESLLGPWVRRFLLEHLVAERNLSHNTQASYRDTLMLLLPFACRQGSVAIDRMTVEDLTPAIVRKFLDHLERDRQCSDVTRNQRLATIHSLARFIGMRSPVHLAWCAEIRGIPFKKTAKTVIGYLEKAEMDALLTQPDRRTNLGARDHALLLFLYNSGARADEAAKLTIDNLQLDASPSVRLHGKGNKYPNLSIMAGDRNVADPPRDRPGQERRSLSEPGKPAFDAVRNTPGRDAIRRHWRARRCRRWPRSV